MMKNLTLSLMLMLSTVTVEAQDIIGKSNHDTMSKNLNDVELTCLLTDSELVQRKNELQMKVFSRVNKMDEVDDGYLFHFEDVDSLLPDLFHYVLSENECCPFFRHDVTIGSNNSGITWKVSGKEGVKEMLGLMLEEIEFPEK